MGSSLISPHHWWEALPHTSPQTVHLARASDSDDEGSASDPSGPCPPVQAPSWMASLRPKATPARREKKRPWDRRSGEDGGKVEDGRPARGDELWVVVLEIFLMHLGDD